MLDSSMDVVSKLPKNNQMYEYNNNNRNNII